MGWEKYDSPPVPPPTDPAPVPSIPAAAAVDGWDVALARFDAAVDKVFTRKKRIPEPVPCGGCGGLAWA